MATLIDRLFADSVFCFSVTHASLLHSSNFLPKYGHFQLQKKHKMLTAEIPNSTNQWMISQLLHPLSLQFLMVTNNQHMTNETIRHMTKVIKKKKNCSYCVKTLSGSMCFSHSSNKCYSPEPQQQKARKAVIKTVFQMLFIFIPPSCLLPPSTEESKSVSGF